MLLIAGSGPTDQDGNSTTLRGHNDSLKMLAAALAEAGVASLRYDKRGIGESVKAPGAAAILRLQLAGKLPADLAARNEAILASLERGTPVGRGAGAARCAVPAPVQPYLVSWFKWVPADEFARLRMLALVLPMATPTCPSRPGWWRR